MCRCDGADGSIRPTEVLRVLSTAELILSSSHIMPLGCSIYLAIIQAERYGAIEQVHSEFVAG